MSYLLHRLVRLKSYDSRAPVAQCTRRISMKPVVSRWFDKPSRASPAPCLICYVTETARRSCGNQASFSRMPCPVSCRGKISYFWVAVTNFPQGHFPFAFALCGLSPSSCSCRPFSTLNCLAFVTSTTRPCSSSGSNFVKACDLIDCPTVSGARKLSSPNIYRLDRRIHVRNAHKFLQNPSSKLQVLLQASLAIFCDLAGRL